MARLIYSAITSLDGYVADDTGDFDWAAPDAEVHAAVNDLERGIGTYLYGRRMYDVMAVWETMPMGADQSAVTRDFADIWRAADKVVYSSTLEAPRTPRTMAPAAAVTRALPTTGAMAIRTDCAFSTVMPVSAAAPRVIRYETGAASMATSAASRTHR